MFLDDQVPRQRICSKPASSDRGCKHVDKMLGQFDRIFFPVRKLNHDSRFNVARARRENILVSYCFGWGLLWVKLYVNFGVANG